MFGGGERAEWQEGDYSVTITYFDFCDAIMSGIIDLATGTKRFVQIEKERSFEFVGNLLAVYHLPRLHAGLYAVMSNFQGYRKGSTTINSITIRKKCNEESL